MEVGQLIKQRRLELKLTLEDVGNAVGVGKSTVKKWEDGYIANMKRDKIAALADILQISPILLMGCENDTARSVTTKIINFNLSADEIALINAYRSKPQMHEAIKAILDIKQQEPITPAPERTIKIAAYGGGITEHQFTATDEDIKDALLESDGDPLKINSEE